MKLKIDRVTDEELKDYLISQDGIEKVIINKKDFITELNIEYDNKINSLMVMKYIELFENLSYSALIEFDKEKKGEFKILKYVVDDMCCEYCYKYLVMELFENNYVNSVKSNFDFSKLAYNIEFIIEYEKKYEEKTLIEFIDERK